MRHKQAVLFRDVRAHLLDPWGRGVVFREPVYVEPVYKSVHEPDHVSDVIAGELEPYNLANDIAVALKSG